MDSILLVAIFHAAIISATPILYAALGEIFAERSGVMNLGVEGMMLVGAATGFIVVVNTQSLMLGTLVAIFAGLLLGLVFAFLVVTLQANQVVTGLVLTIFGTGLSGFLGKQVIGMAAPISYKKVPIPFLSEIPYFGHVFFNHDVLVYIAYLLVPICWFIIYRSRAGLELRSVGENPSAADSVGLNVFRIRYLYICIGGAFAGLAGAYLSLAYAPAWAENMTAGRGWIAIVLVIFATWNPARAWIGALIFGGVDVLGFRLQAIGIEMPSFFVRMLPYIFTIVVLTFITYKSEKAKNLMPKALTIPYDREGR
ncbi:MAG: ABC transporter permease [Desulfitibacter sp. BRH_c19]|nr:MAG: ABC transporter permease [Desulfitibacter sp. BRH_c19]